MERATFRKKANEYLNSLKDMHNIAKEEFDNAKSDVEKQVATMLIATVDACIEGFEEVFELPKTIKKEIIQ